MGSDSAPQYQRATPEDLEWLERELWAAEWEARPTSAGTLRRILNSLRATPAASSPSLTEAMQDAEEHLLTLDYKGREYKRGVLDRLIAAVRSESAPAVPDREALARALFVRHGGTPSGEETRARMWPQENMAVSREHWMGEADRMVRVLGGFPAVTEQPPFGWYVERFGDDGGGAFTFIEPKDSPGAQRATALFAAPPAPVVLEEEPRAWECTACGNLRPWRFEKCNGNPGVLTHPIVERSSGIPLFAAPPQVETQTT